MNVQRAGNERMRHRKGAQVDIHEVQAHGRKTDEDSTAPSLADGYFLDRQRAAELY